MYYGVKTENKHGKIIYDIIPMRNWEESYELGIDSSLIFDTYQEARKYCNLKSYYAREEIKNNINE